MNMENMTTKGTSKYMKTKTKIMEKVGFNLIPNTKQKGKK
jgi:hypothetical protein